MNAGDVTSSEVAEEHGPAAGAWAGGWRVRVGVGAAVVAFIALSTVGALLMPLYWPVDELGHVPYAQQVAGGALPDIDTPVDAGGRLAGMDERLRFEVLGGHGEHRRAVWLANHPPLYYALAGLPHQFAGDGPAGVGAHVAARLLTVALGAAGVVASAALARVLLPAQPRVAVATAGLVALTPTLVHFSGMVYTDALAFTLGTATVAAACVVLICGARVGPVLATSALGAAGALTRSTGLAMTAFAVVAACAAAPVGGITGARRWVRNVGAAAFIGLGTAASAGWFYLRNLSGYGSITGSSALIELMGRERLPWSEILADPGVVGRVLSGQVASFATGDLLEADTEMLLRRSGAAILWLLAVALVAGILRRWSRRDPGWARASQVMPWALVASVPLGYLGLTLAHLAAGGRAHPRYLLGGLAVLGLLGAVGLLGPRWARAAVGVAISALWAVNVVRHHLFAHGWRRSFRVDGTPIELVQPSIPSLLLVALNVAAAFGVIGVLAAVFAPDRSQGHRQRTVG